MGISNIGYGLGVYGIFLLLVLIFWISLIVAIFQIRSFTRHTSEKLDMIYKLLLKGKEHD